MKALLLLFLPLISMAQNRLINGTLVDPSEAKHIVSIRTGNSGCTATVIGKHTIITAAHCAKTGATSTFKIDGTSYSAKMTRSSLYPGRDHDICVGFVANELPVTPASVTGLNVLNKGATITIWGYGCTKQGGGGADGKLRKGDAEVTGFTGYDVVTQGSGLCYGDSGGPAFLDKKQVSVNSKGNIKDTNYTARLDTQESQDFLKKWSTDKGALICGINAPAAECGEVILPPPDPQVFVMDAKTLGIKVTVLPSSPMSADDVKAKLQIVLNQLDKRGAK